MKRILPILIIILLSNFIKSQSCGSCSVNVTGLDSTVYTVSTGQKFCINTNGNFIGSITLSGGTVCVSGVFNPKNITLNSGTINNYGNVTLNSSVTLGNGAQLTNNSGAIVNINGTITLNTGALSNAGIFNVQQNISNSGSITNTSIINCVQLTGTGSLNDSGIINSN